MRLIALIAALALSGCATVEMCQGDLCWKSRTLFKNISDVSASTENFEFEMAGSTTNLSAEQLEAALCLVARSNC